MKVYWLPTLKGALELSTNHPEQALVFLEAALPYELGQPPQLQVGTMYPVYLRAQAQLAIHNGGAAAAEFQKFLDPPGGILNFSLGTFARPSPSPPPALPGHSPKP